jgi:hypothetical protein
MLREYIVTIERSDRDKPDPIEIFAADRDDAIKTVKSIYRRRFRALIGARLKKPKPMEELEGTWAWASRPRTSSSIELEVPA